jgi:nitrogen fixation protein NifU and related proteins
MHSSLPSWRRAPTLDRPFAELDTLYREVVLDHYRSPRGREALPSPDVQQDGFNPICGDEVHVALDMDDGGVRNVQIKCRGCAISVASGSMLAEILPGMTREQIERMTEVFRKMIHGEDPPAELEMGDLSALHGVAKFPVRVKCALLPWMTLKAALLAWGDGQSAPTQATSTEEPREERPQ